MNFLVVALRGSDTVLLVIVVRSVSRFRKVSEVV
jgi:hypothetical protein